MSELTLIAVSLVSAALGYWGHELCHWAVAYAFDRDARLDWWPVGGVETVWPIDEYRWYDGLALLAPQVLGLTLVVTALLVGTVPVVLVPGWLTLTLVGSREDFYPAKRALFGRSVDEEFVAQ